MDYVCIGSSPIEENCIQVGSEDYYKFWRKEAQVFLLQLQEQFPDTLFQIRTFPHDFGSYCEVVALFDENNEESTSNAFLAEEFTPLTWTEASRQKLGEEYFQAVKKSNTCWEEHWK